MNAGIEVLSCDFELLTASDLLSVFEPDHFKWWGACNFTLKDDIRALKCIYRGRLLAKNRRFYKKKNMRTCN